MDKHERKAAVKRWKHVERTAPLAGMPIAPEKLHQLLDHLDSNLTACDRTPKLTAMFLDREQLDKDKILPWLAEHGGYCDCEVLGNLTDLDESLHAPPPRPEIRPKQNRVPRDLQTVTGWNLAELPAPWRVANLYAPAEPIRLACGKKGGCSIDIVEAPLPPGDHACDEFWSELWYARTELPPRGALQVSRGVLKLPDGFQSTLVRSPSWLPVFCWIVPASSSWYLEVRTESLRYAGDLPQIAALIARLAKGDA